jgi:hypothetical protein
VMRRSGLALLLGLVLVLVVIVAVRPASAAPVQQDACPGNRLVNPGFEAGSHKTESLGTSLSSAVGDGWVPWFVRGNATINREPEFKVEQTALGGDPHRVRSGANAQKWFTTWGTHTAGIYQPVAVPRGSAVTFSIYAMVYSGEADGWNGDKGMFLSDPEKPGNYRVWVGIDPTGALPACMGCPPPDTVVWSPESMTTDVWVPMSISTVAQGDKVTAYTKSAQDWSVKHNDSFWDDACLVAGGKAVVAKAVAGAPKPANQPAAKAPAPVRPVVAAKSAAASSIGPRTQGYTPR